jgi:DNA-binding transcriptional LysR family regulator
MSRDEYPSPRQLDLNLLRPLRALLEERHVSRAAARCDISQPAMSRILERLRDLLHDELIVRASGSYVRTPRGEQLLCTLDGILERIDSAIANEPFDPARFEGTFHIATTDYISIVLVPLLIAELEQHAPKASIAVTIWDDRRGFDELEAGRVHVAITSAEDPPATLRYQYLLTEHYACAIARDHPFDGDAMDLATYLSYGHAVVDVRHGVQPAADRPVVRLGSRRRVTYRTPFIGAAVFAVARSRLILTIPEQLAKAYSGLDSIRVLDAPAEIGTFQHALVWHRRLDASPSHVWLRERIHAAANTVGWKQPRPRRRRAT